MLGQVKYMKPIENAWPFKTFVFSSLMRSMSWHVFSSWHVACHRSIAALQPRQHPQTSPPGLMQKPQTFPHQEGKAGKNTAWLLKTTAHHAHVAEQPSLMLNILEAHDFSPTKASALEAGEKEL